MIRAAGEVGHHCGVQAIKVGHPLRSKLLRHPIQQMDRLQHTAPPQISSWLRPAVPIQCVPDASSDRRALGTGQELGASADG